MASPSTAAAIGLAAREAAWRVLLAVAAGAYADVALERELRRSSLPPADRALATELALGAIRQRRLLDAWLDACGRVPAARQPPKLRWLLHIGLYQLLFCRSIPAAAAVTTTVELAKRQGLARLAPVVNGLLRSVQRRRPAAPPTTPGEASRLPDPWAGLPLPADPVEAFGLRHSLPDSLARDLHRWLPAERAEAFAHACNSPPPFDLRANPLRTTRAELLAAFAAAGIAAAPLPDLPHGLTLRTAAGDPRRLPGYAEGHWSVQDRNAQRIVPLLDPRPAERILDACAAPGGKATQLAEALAGSGALWAVDRSASRLQRLQVNAERLGLVGAIHVLAADATRLAEARPDWRGFFDAVLLDAPCSGLGTLARHADARWRIDPTRSEELVDLQQRLLEALAPLLRPGGRLVYATCSVHPRENEERIAAFLAAHPDWRRRGEHCWWPGAAAGGDGFYAAVLEAPLAAR